MRTLTRFVAAVVTVAAAPTGRCGRSSIRESCLTRCPLLRTGRASAANGSMWWVTGWAIPTASNEPLYGRTDTKSPTVYSSMVHVAGGEGGSTRHDDDTRPVNVRDLLGGQQILISVGVEVLVGGPARSQYDPVVYRSTRASNLPNAVSASTATTLSSWRTCAKIDATQAATVVLPIRVGGVVVTDHKPGRR
jgi:hypothetical protein